MRLVTWNVNGFRAVLKKGFQSFFEEIQADIFCLQETKIQSDQVEVFFEGYEAYWNSAEKKGYSGTAVFTRIKPLQVTYDIGDPLHFGEGRAITLEFDRFFLVNVYTPNSQRELARLPYRMEWEKAFLYYIKSLDQQKPVIFCGDLNVAHNEIDLKNPKTNRLNAGFSDEERQKMTELLESGFVDSFRYLYPDRKDAYTWWSYMFQARERNVGWRIDYFILSERIRDKIRDCVLYPMTMGSDHCPVVLDISDYTD
jgi:exodeoxyribonuclease-3